MLPEYLSSPPREPAAGGPVRPSVSEPRVNSRVTALNMRDLLFHLENTATAIDGNQLKLKDGGTLAADLMVVASAYGRGLNWLKRPD